MIAYIDNINIYTQFGVAIAEKGYNDLVQYPSLKKVESNNWAEKNGIEPDLSSPCLDTKNITIKLFAHGHNADVGGLIELLSNEAYHTFRFPELDREFKLRLSDMNDLDSIRNSSLFSLSFADDFPLPDYTYLAPLSTYARPSGYKLDERCLSTYGIMVLEGLDEVNKSPKVKQNLLRNINSVPGAIYSNKQVVYDAKDVKLDLSMRASTMAEFWRNYNAFLYDLTRPDERQLYVSKNNCSYPCFYKSSNTEDFYPVRGNTKAWHKFSLTVTFTNFTPEL